MTDKTRPISSSNPPESKGKKRPEVTKDPAKTIGESPKKTTTKSK